MKRAKISNSLPHKYMLDSATCGAILRRGDAADRAVLERLTQHVVGEICISAVTLSELMHGVEISRRSAQERAALEVFLRHIASRHYLVPMVGGMTLHGP